MNIDLYCVCWNEIKVLPFVIEYWKKFVRHAYVFDNESDDGTVEYLSQFDWITIIPFNTKGFNDMNNLNIKNNCWKNSDADWVVVCDLDECLYNENLKEKLYEYDKEDITIVIPLWKEVYCKDFPNNEENTLLHERCDKIITSPSSQCFKAILFKPQLVQEMNYSPGCHQMNPRLLYGSVHTCDENDNIYLFHLKHLGIDYYYKRCRTLEERRSDMNKRFGWGIHYNITYEQAVEEFSKAINAPQ